MIHLVCIGHAKCGTTLLDSVFRQSRLLATPAETKEIKFFLPRFFPQETARERYLEKFATADGRHPVAGTFEASPQYSHQPEEILRAVLENIKRTLPHAKVVICFRHPVLRAYSHYIHNLHTFALYGEGVFSPRPDLLRKPCRMSFEEALANTSRLQVSYATTLRIAYEVLGRERVLLFFLEKDGSELEHWIRLQSYAEIADEVAPVASNTEPVFVRRPVPNYLICGSALHAFGSNAGEYIRYEGVSAPMADNVMSAQKAWTLALNADDVARLTDMYFREDLLKCSSLSGDISFSDYVRTDYCAEFAELTPRSALESLHGVAAGDMKCREVP